MNPSSGSNIVATCATNAIDELDSRGLLRCGANRDEKVMAARAAFQELHHWSTEHLPMGADAHLTQEALKVGLRQVQRRFTENKAEMQQKYGCDPLTVLTVISALFSIITNLVKWWRGTV